MTETVDTGFEDAIAGEVWHPPEPPPEVTATVIPEPAPPVPDAPLPPAGLTDAGVQAAKALIRLPVISPSDLAKMAREFAMNIRERHVILAENNLTDAQYDFLETYNGFYKSALHAACIEWHAPLSTPERIKIEAGAILEESLPALGARMQNKSEGLPGVVEAAKLFAKVAGVGEREAGQGNPSERFTINIDLGGDKNLTASVVSIPQPPAGDDPGSPVLRLPET